MDYQAALDYINSYTWSQWKLGLSRTKALMEALGNPQKNLRFVHVAGSNGKGSTCAMLASVLTRAGYKTGFFPSPYIEEFCERIRVDGAYITREALCRITERVRGIADAMEDHPSQFELITAIGMVYFAECGCDLVVLEVGLGGEFDATNVIDAPEVAVITHIGLEHTEYLGDTLEKIAETKSGIIKRGSDVVLYENEPEVTGVVTRVCEERGCPLHRVSFARLSALAQDLDGQDFSWDGLSLHIPLLGMYQLHNAATVLTVIEALRARGFEIPEEAVVSGLSTVSWPARFEVLRRDPLFILDGGHNPQCAEALAESIRTYLLPEDDAAGKDTHRIVFLAGVLSDKDFHEIIDLLSPFAAHFVCVTPDSPRALPAEDLCRILRERGLSAEWAHSVPAGVKRALDVSAGRPVIAFGSLYMAGDIRRAVLSPTEAP